MKDMIKYWQKTLVLILLALPFSVNGQEYAASDIPSDLRENAFAVVRNHTAVFSQSDANNATYKVTRVITILDKKGDAYAHFDSYGDKFRNLSSFLGVVRDASGKVIKKIKKGDLEISSFSGDAFATDDYSISYECQSPSYPFTVEYSYEEKWKNGILNYPVFNPVLGFYLSLESAQMQVELPVDTELRYKTNYEYKKEQSKSDKQNINTFSVDNFKAVKQEPYHPNYKEVFPYLRMAPGKFCYDSYCGDMNSWQNYGLWMAGLLKGRDELPAELVNKLKSLTENASTEREKVKLIYEYLQKNTRYVSVQLGIGGFQPFYANSVAKTGFGDCKGLSNYMLAMLKAIGIPSYYCEISMRDDDKYLYTDYTSVSQTNHVILLVPLKNDSIWLECTSQTMPFGYIHEDIAGHDALVISEQGGTICRLPSYENIPTSCTSLTISLKEDGAAEGHISLNERLGVYEKSCFIFNDNDRVGHTKYINSYLKIPGTQIGDIKTSENRSEMPSAHLNATFSAVNFANKTGSRLFVPLCPINKGSFNGFSSSERSLDIFISRNFSESDTITINIPESFVLESLPKDIDKETKFGRLQSQIRMEDNKIVYIQNIGLFKGKYDKSDYADIKAFFSEINSAIKRKLVLKKQT